MKWQSLAASLGVLVVLACMGGCSKTTSTASNRIRVTGTVLLDGKPLPGGNITLVSTKNEKSAVTYGIKADGTFSMTNAPVGGVLIAVDTRPMTLKNPKKYVPIPEKYTDAKTSGLIANIPSVPPEGGNKVTVELKSK